MGIAIGGFDTEIQKKPDAVGAFDEPVVKAAPAAPEKRSLMFLILIRQVARQLEHRQGLKFSNQSNLKNIRRLLSMKSPVLQAVPICQQRALRH